MLNRPENFFAPVGIESKQQYNYLQQTFYDANEELITETIGVGVLMSEKTGLLCIENRHGEIYPLPENLKAIVESRKNADPYYSLNLILHYNTDNPHVIGEQLERSTAPYLEAIDAIQVNGLRTDDLDSLKEFKDKHDIPIIMQIDRELLELYGPKELVYYLAPQRSAFDYVWLDGSGGEGVNLDTQSMLQYIESFRELLPKKGIGVAGGLTPENLEESLGPILEQDPDISWDAQSGVQSLQEGKKHFDLTKARRMILGSIALRNSYPTN